MRNKPQKTKKRKEEEKMKKEEQMKENKQIIEVYKMTKEERENVWCYNSVRLYSCSAQVYECKSGYFLKSYRTVIAYIPFDENICFDFLRYVYGYTATSAQHITKFMRKYNVTNKLTYKDI